MEKKRQIDIFHGKLSMDASPYSPFCATVLLKTKGPILANIVQISHLLNPFGRS